MDRGHGQAGLMAGVVEPGEPSSEFLASRQTNEKKLTKEELKRILDNLGPYSDTIDENGAQLMTYATDQFPTYFTCVETTMTTTSTTSTAIRFLNILHHFYNNLLSILQNPLKEESRELHIVLVAKGSFSDQFHPADWLIPGESITDTILYSPWNCRIDSKVAYGIATGNLQPGHRDFRNNQAEIMQQQEVPNHWNSIRAHPQQPVPEIILGPLNGAADLLAQSLDERKRLLRNYNHFIIPYPPANDLADLSPGIPLYKMITAIKILLRIIPPYKATIHLAADLGHNGDAEPDVARLNHQYAFTPDDTVMTTQGMQFNHLEFPALYDLFQFIFDPEPPQ